MHIIKSDNVKGYNTSTLYVYTESAVYSLECGLDLAQWIACIEEIFAEYDSEIVDYEYCMESGLFIFRQDIDEKVRYNIDLYPEFAEIFCIKY